MSIRRSLGGLVVIAVLLTASLSAIAATDIPLRNWSAPATWTPPNSAGAQGARTALVTGPAQGFPVPFIPVTPCRVMDTRGNGQTGNFGTPQLGVNVTRTIYVPTHPTCTGIASATAYSLNVTVTNTGAQAFGYLQVWPTGSTQPTSSNLNYPGAGATLANAVIVPSGTSGGINVFSGNASADVIIDINGYYAWNTTNASGGFEISTSNIYAIYGVTNAANGYGVEGIGSGTGGTGVYGFGAANGVYGQSTSGKGVYGLSTGGTGVFGTSSTGLGMRGESTAWNGVWAQSTTGDGLFATGGRHGAYITGAQVGVWGVSSASSGFIGGVYGIAGTGATDNYWSYSGVRGTSDNIGVLGFSTSLGVVGSKMNGTGGLVTGAYLGYSATDGVHAIGNISATGTKPFIDPHPTDPSRVIRYIALEGPEAGTYFRGRARFEGGTARIEVPEDFRLVTDADGISVQITPIGGLASVAVMQADLNEIVVHSNRNVEFFYLVNGIRAAFKNTPPILENTPYYVPLGVTYRMPGAFSEEQRRRLIANGTYNSDGTVNMQTAERLGWAQKWREDEAKAKAAPAK